MSSRNFTIDENLWQRILKSKNTQGLAWKIEQAMQKEGEPRELVKLLVEKWAKHVGVRRCFPDLKDVFTPDAIFRIEYAHRLLINDGREHRSRRGGDSAGLAWRIYDVLAHVSNLVARHDISISQLKRAYNNYVQRWSETVEALPLFDESEVVDARQSVNKKLFIPQGISAKKKQLRKTARAVEKELSLLEPKFSIQGGRLIITEGGAQ